MSGPKPQGKTCLQLPGGHISRLGHLLDLDKEQAYMDTMARTATAWMLPAMTLAAVVCALISGMVGLRLLRRQFERAGMTA